MSKKLPTKVTLPSGVNLPDEFYDSVFDYLQDKYGRDAGLYPEAYGIEIIVDGITWGKME